MKTGESWLIQRGRAQTWAEIDEQVADLVRRERVEQAGTPEQLPGPLQRVPSMTLQPKLIPLSPAAWKSPYGATCA